MPSSDRPQLNSALNAGLDNGLSVAAAQEILVQLYAYTGFPKSLNALGELLKVLETREQHGIADPPGCEPQRLRVAGDELITLGKANQTKLAGGPVEGPVFELAPVINEFLHSHVQAGLPLGLSAGQLRQLAEYFGRQGRGDAAARIDDALGLVLGATSGA